MAVVRFLCDDAVLANTVHVGFARLGVLNVPMLLNFFPQRTQSARHVNNIAKRVEPGMPLEDNHNVLLFPVVLAVVLELLGDLSLLVSECYLSQIVKGNDANPRQ